MKVFRAIAIRLGWNVLTLFAISVLIFVAMNYKSPTEIARAAIGRDASPEDLESYARSHHLYDSMASRYLDWLGNALRGDLGTSPITNRPVAETILPGLERTLTLAAMGALIALPVSLWLGSYMARRIGQRRDLGVLMGTVTVAATPEFVVTLGLLMVFGVGLGWLPIEAGSSFAFGTSTDKLVAYILPAMAVAVVIVPHLYRFVRACVSEGLQAPYAEAAELRGLSRRTVYWDFVLRNSAGPIITVAAFNLAYAVSGLVAIESVTSFPGIGSNLVQSIGQGDVITVQAIALIMASVILTIFLVADLLTIALNPRLRLRS